MKMRLLLLCTFLLCSCANKTMVISPDYKKNAIKKAGIVVVLMEQPDINNTDDVTDDFGEGDPDELYLKHFNQKFTEYLQKYTYLSPITIDTLNAQMTFIEETLELNQKKDIIIKVPQSSEKYVFNGFEPEYILFIQKFSIIRKAATSGVFIPGPPGRPGGYTGGTSPALLHVGEMLVWDNYNQKKVLYGQFDAKATFLFAMTKNVWDAALKDMILTIFKDSPFMLKSTVRR